jgi:hypothetical protein
MIQASVCLTILEIIGPGENGSFSEPDLSIKYAIHAISFYA